MRGRLRQAIAALSARLRPAPPASFAERLGQAIERQDGVLLRVGALERSLAGRASDRPVRTRNPYSQ